MKQYYEFGVAKEGEEIIGFFIKGNDKYPFFVSYKEFVEMVKQNQIQDLYWDDSAGIKVEIRDDSNTPKKVRGRVEKAMAKVPAVTDFNTFVRRDAIFRYSGEKDVIPAAVLLVSRTFFIDVVTIAMPYTKEVEQLYHGIKEKLPEYKDLFVLNAGGLSLSTTPASIGTDTVVGDALGPLVGTSLVKMFHSDLQVYGTLENPVDAKNVEQIIKNIKQEFENAFVIVIDASFSTFEERKGLVTFSLGGLKPGAATRNDLPEIGDLAVRGIVAGGKGASLFESKIRLADITVQVDFIAKGLYKAYKNVLANKDFNQALIERWVTA